MEDTSDVDADDEHEDEDGHVSINAPPTESSVKFKKGMAKKSTETNTETKVGWLFCWSFFEAILRDMGI